MICKSCACGHGVSYHAPGSKLHPCCRCECQSYTASYSVKDQLVEALHKAEERIATDMAYVARLKKEIKVLPNNQRITGKLAGKCPGCGGMAVWIVEECLEEARR